MGLSQFGFVTITITIVMTRSAHFETSVHLYKTQIYDIISFHNYITSFISLQLRIILHITTPPIQISTFYLMNKCIVSS